MNNVTFYQLHSSLYQIAAPKIIIKIIDSCKKVHFLCKTYDEELYLDNLLWSFSKLCFIPHSTNKKAIDKNICNLIITGNNKNLIYKNRALISSSVNLLTSSNTAQIKNIIIITIESINLNSISNKLRNLLNVNKIKYFIQNAKNTWLPGEIIL